MRFKFVCNDYDDGVVTHETGEVVLPALMQQIRLFLLGAGFDTANVDEYIEPD